MPVRLSDHMQQDIERWCRRIVSGCGDNDDVFDELYGHIEDRMLAYMNGEAAVSEDDAFLLVREHFGSPERVRSRLQEAHPMPIEAFPRRKFLVTSAATMLAVFIISLPVMYLIAVELKRIFAASTMNIFITNSYFQLTMVMKYAFIVAVLTVLPFLYVLYMKLREPGGHVKTYNTLKKQMFSVTVLYLAVMTVFTLFVHSRLMLYGLKHVSLPNDIMPMVDLGGLVSGFLRQSTAIGFFAVLPFIVNCLKKHGEIDFPRVVMTRSWRIITAVILGAVLSPPDPLSMIALTIIMLMTFEIAQMLLRIYGRVAYVNS